MRTTTCYKCGQEVLAYMMHDGHRHCVACIVRIKETTYIMTKRLKRVALYTFKRIMIGCWHNRGRATGITVRFFVGEDEYELVNITQGEVIPNVQVTLKKF